MRSLRAIPNWGRYPQTPEFFAFQPEWIVLGSGLRPPPGPFRPLSRRSGCVPAVPYPPLRYSQSGRHQPRRAMIFHRTAITPLTHCLSRGVHSSCCPFPRTPFSANGALPSLRSGQVSLDEAEHFRHNRDASVAYAPMVFGIIPECRSDSLRNERSASPESPPFVYRQFWPTRVSSIGVPTPPCRSKYVL
jgi:hypothetical protein